MELGLNDILSFFPPNYVAIAMREATVMAVIIVALQQVWLYLYAVEGRPAFYRAETAKLAGMKAAKMTALATVKAKNRALSAALEMLVKEMAIWDGTPATSFGGVRMTPSSTAPPVAVLPLPPLGGGVAPGPLGPPTPMPMTGGGMAPPTPPSGGLPPLPPMGAMPPLPPLPPRP
jgi:hypothetical protein